MKKYYFTIITILFFGLLSCSSDENKTQTQLALRPSVPILDNRPRDIDGNVYSVVTIGTQKWLRTNLNVSHYRNGDAILQLQNGVQNSGYWCYYNNNPSNGPVYGKLYNWYAVNDPRGLAPVGWHVPSAAEWGTLQNYLGGEAVAGGKMREVGTIHWLSGDFASNSSGFTALPGGYRLGNFNDIGGHGYWWSTTTDSYITINAFIRDIETNSNSLGFNSGYKEAGYSVRCIKD